MLGTNMATWPPAEVSDEQLSGEERLAVDVYHINIGTGDSTIYYLVQWPPQEKKDQKPYIHRACLIDGGEKRGARAIEQFLMKVNDRYSFNAKPKGRPELKFPPFDSIVSAYTR